MNLGDPELELVDPTPNVHALFLHFDDTFFWSALVSRAVVRWSKRMYSCAGICYYKDGFCDIALSEPLLKLRPRKDLVETLLHEMIHAYLFITRQDNDRDGHGPNFQKFMHRINKEAGLNISIYHDFHDEVKLYRTHWWRCNGPCQSLRPHFGIVRRTTNRAPGPSDYWFESHRRQCGGTFIKIKEPEKKNKKSATGITNHITNYINDATDKNMAKTPVLKVNNNDNTLLKGNVKGNGSGTFIVNKKNVVFNPAVPKPKQIPVFTGNGRTFGISRSNTVDVVEAVRNVWANKQLVVSDNKVGASNPIKHKSFDNVTSPPAKIKKIDDYFRTAATSVLKDLYGDDIKLTQANDTNKLRAVIGRGNLVECPICNAKINNDEINRHLDECLNKDIINKLSKSDTDKKTDTYKIKLIDTLQIPAFKGKDEHIDLTKIKTDTGIDNMKEILLENKNHNVSNLIDDSILVNNENPDKSQNTRESGNFVTSSGGDTLVTESKMNSDELGQICPCCGKKYDKPIQEHLDECLIFFDNDSTLPEERASTSNIDTIVIDDDDDGDESLLLNDTGTKCPCPCCMQMVEQADMNDHLDVCLQS